MAVLSGVNALIQVASMSFGSGGSSEGTFATISDCAGWTFDSDIEIKSYVSCSTGGAKMKVVGPKDSKGTLIYFYNEGQAILSTLHEGATVALKLYLDQAANPAGAAGSHSDSYIIVPALIKSVKTGARSDSADPIQMTIDFEGNGLADYSHVL